MVESIAGALAELACIRMHPHDVCLDEETANKADAFETWILRYLKQDEDIDALEERYSEMQNANPRGGYWAGADKCEVQMVFYDGPNFVVAISAYQVVYRIPVSALATMPDTDFVATFD